jgi:hypothetical protein
MQKRLDGHLHVGVVYGGKNPDTPAPADRCAEYLKANQITHAGVCYTSRKEMDRLVDLCPEIKFYKYQWIASYEQQFDEDIQGFKLHSHRGLGFSFGADKQGLEYTSKEMDKLLARMPENMILQYHTQGSSSFNNTSRPLAIAQLATKHRHLKHIIVHAGSYGLMSYYPSKVEPVTIMTALAQENLVQEAVLVANRLANVYLDSSTLIGLKHAKSDLLTSGTKKAALGSDWPYCEKSPYGPILAGEKLLKRIISEEDISNMHERALHFLDTDVNQLFQEEGEIVNEYAGRSERFLRLLNSGELNRRSKKKDS